LNDGLDTVSNGEPEDGQHAVESLGLATLNPPDAKLTANTIGKVIKGDFGVRAELPLAA